jgi:hypothetical protein
VKGFITFHEIPEMIFLVTGLQGRFIMQHKAGGYLAAMKTLFHYN